MPMDWMQIVNSHVKWKTRLRNYLEGKGEENLFPELVCKDDSCDLGQWIYGEGKAHESSPTYALVKENHAAFHQHAAEIVRLVDANRREDAEKLMGQEYAKLCERLKHGIITLFQEVNQSHP